MEYTVHTEQFEGPLDLLLDLIQEQKLDITRVSLATITDGYIAHVQSQEQISLTHLADFLEVAAKLILIKSKALLPLLQFDDEEESDIEELEHQLAALKVIKDIIPDFLAAFHKAQPQFARKNMWGITPQFTPPRDITPEHLKEAFLVSLQAIPQLDKLEEKIITDIVSLEKRIADVQEMVAARAQVAFSDVIKDAKNTGDVVVSFLALLELVKQSIVSVKQGNVFEDIELYATQK